MVVRVHPMPQRYAFIKVCYILFRLFFHLKIHKIFLALRSLWHRGRVARQSSAKACTAVRIRSMPQKPSTKCWVFLFYKSSILSIRSCRSNLSLGKKPLLINTIPQMINTIPNPFLIKTIRSWVKYFFNCLAKMILIRSVAK